MGKDYQASARAILEPMLPPGKLLVMYMCPDDTPMSGGLIYARRDGTYATSAFDTDYVAKRLEDGEQASKALAECLVKDFATIAPTLEFTPANYVLYRGMNDPYEFKDGPTQRYFGMGWWGFDVAIIDEQ